MNFLCRIIDRIIYISGYISAVLLICINCLVLLEVISRYALHSPLIVADEYSGYAMVFLCIVGLGYAMREGSHIRITFVVSNLPHKITNWLRVVTLFLFLGYSCLAAVVSYDFVGKTISRNIHSNTLLMTPLVWPRLALPIGFTLLALFLVVEILKTVRAAKAGDRIEQH